MKKIKIAFDIDGTIRSNIEPYEHGDTSLVKWNYRICELAMTLASMKNTKLILWSGGGIPRPLLAEQESVQIGTELLPSDFDGTHAGMERWIDEMIDGEKDEL